MPKKITQNVNKDKVLNDLPKVNPQKSTWLNRHTNYQSCNMGQIVPIYYQEILPDEEKEITMGMISHTTTPIAPIFPSMYTEIRVFFVPTRLCADLLNGYKTRKSPWVKVFGEDNKSSSSDVIVPLDEQALPGFKADDQFIEDIVSYFNNVDSYDHVFDSLDISESSSDGSGLKDFNFLPLAAYELIYQRHYRNENFESSTSSKLYQLLFDAYNSEKASVELPSSFTFEIANREKDYFTGAKPYTLKASSPVMIGVGSEAPVEFHSNADLGQLASNVTVIEDGGRTIPSDAFKVGTKTGKLVADLSSATGISVEELRLLVKTQELLEKDAIYGSRYAESLNAHFGCCPLDTTLQDPQELHKVTITSHMQAIFQTSSTSGEASILGTIGANSTTQTDPFVILPKTKFKEHGILMICAVHKLQNVYDSNYFKPRFNFKRERFDFYTPELDDLGYQSVKSQEALALSSRGFNEAFAEYRYVFNKSHGSLNISFKYWAPSIANEYSSLAVLYKEDSDIIDKALSVKSSTAPQFYDAWGFEEKNTKPMKLHSIPGFDGVI